MSASRANAGAKNRRAGGADLNQQPTKQQIMQQQQQQQQQPKLSISDAIGLITLRLGRIENTVQHLQTDVPKSEGTTTTSASSAAQIDPAVLSRFVDMSAFNAIVKRIEGIEQRQKTTPLQAPVQVQQNTFEKEIASLKTSLDETKEMLLKLQSFTMEVNGKLVNSLFTSSSSSLKENEIITLNEPVKEYEAEEDERDEGENDCDIDMSQMFGGQGQGQGQRFDLGAMLQMLSMQQGFREERMQQQQQHPQSDKVIEISGPDIKEMLAVEELDA